ncbi:BRE1-domain-containing protein [Atractiella rhizophila]|nr:BRE1-domain-containing protein [Atractiella rhizophila]
MAAESLTLKRKAPPSPETYSPGPSKKPFIDSALPNGNGNGIATTHAPDLESFRKEAIWRQMGEYKLRALQAEERERELERVLEDERCRAAAVGVFWTKLVEDVRILCDQKSLPHSSDSILDLSASLVDLELPTSTLTSLQTHLSSLQSSTLSLLRCLPPGQNPPTPPSTEDLQSRCSTLVSESSSLRAAVQVLKEDVERLRDERESERERCRAIWKRGEREKSSSVRWAEGRKEEEEKVKVNDTMMEVDEVKPVIAHISKDEQEELEALREIADARLREIEDVRREKVMLENELQSLRLSLVDLPEDTVQESLHYRQLHAHLSFLKADSERAKKEAEELRGENAKMREQQQRFREDVIKEAHAITDDSQKKLNAKESDLTRVRGQREEFRSELTELKAREAEKMKHQEQVKTLALSQKDRLAAYASEVKRLKMRILANNGETELVETYADEELDAMKDLEGRLKRAESLALTLRDQLKSYSQNSGLLNVQTIMQSEEKARMELREVKEQLERLQALVGDAASVEVKQLKERVEERDRRVRILEAQLKTQEASTSMLYGEVDRLSAAWQTLDEQCSNKVFTLVGLEEKVAKLLTEKAKADNRYFAAMRAKEALQGENQVLNRLTDKQQKAVESTLESNKTISASLTNIEQELNQQRVAYRTLQSRFEELTLQSQDLTRKEEVAQKKVNELELSNRQLLESRSAEQRERRKLEEDIIRLQKLRSAAQQQSVIKSQFVNGNGALDAELGQLRETTQHLQKLLKCSSCNERFKSHVITRCFHTFCKECIDARIETRQRKCPGCQVAFGVADVQKIYLTT